MKLKHATLLGVMAGLFALVVFPSTGQVVSQPPVPVNEELEEVDDDGDDGFKTIPGGLNSIAGGGDDGPSTEGLGHWVNSGSHHEPCDYEETEILGPKQTCNTLYVGGRPYHIKTYDPVRRRYRVVKRF